MLLKVGLTLEVAYMLGHLGSLVSSFGRCMSLLVSIVRHIYPSEQCPEFIPFGDLPFLHGMSFWNEGKYRPPSSPPGKQVGPLKSLLLALPSHHLRTKFRASQELDLSQSYFSHTDSNTDEPRGEKWWSLLISKSYGWRNQLIPAVSVPKVFL